MKNVDNTIQIIDSVCGSGKTTKFLDYFESFDFEFSTERWLIALPTKLMCDSFCSDLRKRHVEGHIKIVSDSDLSVVKRLSQSLSDKKHRIVVITHKGLESLATEVFTNKQLPKHVEGWNLLIDEVPNPFSSADFDIIDEEQHTWLKCLTKHDSHYQLDTSDRDKCEQLITMWKERTYYADAARNNLFNLARGYPCLISQYKDKKSVMSWGHTPILDLCCYFDNTYLAAANVNNSPFVYVACRWCRYSILHAPLVFKPDPLRNSHDKKDNVVIHAVFKDRMSISKLETKAYREHSYNYVNKVLNNDYIFSVNKRFSVEACKNLKGEQAPFISHGLNTWINTDKAAWLGIARMSNLEKSLCKIICAMYNSDPDELVWSIESFRQQEATYQFIARTSIRDQSSNNVVTLCVVDDYTAEYIKKYYLHNAQIIYSTFAIAKKSDNTKDAVLLLTQQGMKQKDIAAQLNINVRTVRRYQQQI